MTAASYQACSIKRDRRTKAEVQAIRDSITAILKADHPQTVRQVFYQLVARSVIEKSEAEYQTTVIRLLSEMRLDGRVRWEAHYYRRSALRECDGYIEIWSEKEALAGIIYDAASDYDVPVVVSKGMPSLTQVYGSFVNIRNAAKASKQSYIYQFGDHDPTGCLIPKTIEARLNDFCDKHNVTRPVVERIALTEEQIEEYRLPTRPTKRDGNSHAHKFDGDSVELDALPSADLRALVRDCIERHISLSALNTLREAEQSEREILEQLADDHEVGS
jgi:hypothetical protein